MLPKTHLKDPIEAGILTSDVTKLFYAITYNIQIHVYESISQNVKHINTQNHSIRSPTESNTDIEEALYKLQTTGTSLDNLCC